MDEAALEPSWKMTRWGWRKVGLDAWRSVMAWEMEVRISLLARKIGLLADARLIGLSG